MDFKSVKDLSEEQRLDLIEKVKKMRMMEARPDHLKVLAIKTILKNHKSYIGRAENPLRHLPNTIVQQFLQIIIDARYGSEDLLPPDMERDFLLLLLNPQVTEFNCGKHGYESADIFFRHMLVHCPKMRHINLSNLSVYWNFEQVVSYFDLSFWKNLTHLNMSDLYVTDMTVRMIQQNNPNLIDASFSINSEAFSTKGVESMSKMLNLRSLQIFIHGNKCTFSNNIAETLVHIAGKIKNLQYFNFTGCLYYDQFVHMYGKYYPDKKLILKCVNIRSRYSAAWPSCLSAEKFIFCVQDRPFKNKKDIDAITCPVKNVVFHNVSIYDMFLIVARFGRDITKMKVVGLPDNDLNTFHLSSFLSWCPNLEVMDIRYTQYIKFRFLEELTANHFKNLRRFTCEDALWGCSDNDEIDMIYKMYLTGSTKYEKLDVPLNQLKAMYDFFRENPNKMSQLQEVSFGAFAREAFQLVINFATMLVLCAPHLKKLSLGPANIPQNAEELQDLAKFELFVTRTGIELKLEIYG